MRNKAYSILLFAEILAILIPGVADAVTEKTIVSVTDPSPWFDKGSNSGHPEYWKTYTYSGHTYIWTYVGGMLGNPSQPDCWAKFRPYLSQAGRYDVYALFYADPQNSRKVPHTIYYDGGSTTTTVDEYAPNYFTWREVRLGTWNFKAGADTLVVVTDATGEPYNGTTTLNVDTIKFVKVQTIPYPPTLISPGSSSSPGPTISTLTPTFQWSAASGADYYGLYIRDLATDTLVFDSQARGIQITGTSYVLPSGVLQWGKPYRWNMNSHNSAGWGSYSGVLYFQAQGQTAPPPTPSSPGSSSSPGPTISTLTPTFQWSAASGADYYGLYIRDLATDTLVFDSQARGIQITGTSYVLPSGVLQWGKPYRWNMNSHNSAGWGSYSGVLYFQTAPPPAPTLKWPLQGTLNERTILLGFGADWVWGECPPGVMKKHVGIDVSATVGEDIYAPEAGIVKALVYDSNWKYCVTIEHSGFTTVCWHVDPLVNVGDNVTRGQIIATIADLGANTHLHFGVRGSTYSNISNRGALPQNDCGGDPAFPEYFVDPMTLEYETTQPGARVEGIDVSSYQGDNIDWWQVRNAGYYRFALVRASWGDENLPLGIDDYFETNMINGRAAGMLMGAYHFAYPEYTDPESEARHFLNVAGDYLREGYLRPALDLEDDPGFNSYPYRLNAELTTWILTWMNSVEQSTGARPILYTTRSYARDVLVLDIKPFGKSLTDYDLWIADPECDAVGEPTTTGIWDTWAFWQYWDPAVCGIKSVPGISGGVDLDLFNGDMSRLNTFMIGLDADIDKDGMVNFVDYTLLALRWRDSNCVEPNWCSGADLNKSGSVDLFDLAEFAELWLEGL